MITLSNKIKSITVLISSFLIIGASAEASITIAQHYKSRDHFRRSSLELSADGRRCTRKVQKGQFKISGSSKEENSKACTILKIARRIHDKLGTCTFKTTPETSRDTYFGQKSSLLMLSDREGISFNNPHDFADITVKEECLCGKLVIVESTMGPGKINFMNLLFDGPYYRADVTFNAISANECMSLFNSKQEKEIVQQAYREFGF